MPAVFDRGNGKLLHFDFGGKGSGGWSALGHEHFYVVGTSAFAIESGSSMGTMRASILKKDFLIQGLTGSTFNENSFTKVKGRDRRGREITKTTFKPKQSWPIAGGNWTFHAMAGRHAFAAAGEEIASFDVDAAQAAKAAQRPDWTASINSNVATLLAGDGKLFAVSEDARLFCFGTIPAAVTMHTLEKKPLRSTPPAAAIKNLGRQIVSKCNTTSGYAVSLGIGSGQLIDEILRQTEFHIIVIDPDAAAVAKLRRRMTSAGLYGRRIG